jgi:hypothetical protein
MTISVGSTACNVLMSDRCLSRVEDITHWIGLDGDFTAGVIKTSKLGTLAVLMLGNTDGSNAA